MTGSALWFIDHRFYLQGLDRFSLPAEDLRVPKNATLLIRGWAAAPAIVPAYDLQCRVDGSVAGAVFSEFREDIGKHFQKDSMCDAAFHAAVDMAPLSLGPHELSLAFDGGAHQMPAMPFTVIEPTSVRHTLSHGSRYTATIEAFHCDVSAEAKAFRVQRPAAAVVRGTLADARGRGAPEALYGIVDDFDVYPARIDATTSTFLLCFISRSLTLGEHELRLAVKPRGEAVLEMLAPMRFAVTPIAVDIDFHTSEVSTALGSCSWADDPPTTELVSARMRSFAPGSIAHVRGWAYDTATNDSIQDVHICFENGEQFRMDTRQLRDDVAVKHGVPKARFCGFVGSIAVDALAPGRNVGRAYVIAKDEFSLLSTDATVEIDVETLTPRAIEPLAL